MSVLGKIETAYKTIARVDQNDLVYFLPADNVTYIDLDTKFYVRGKLTSASEKGVGFTDFTGLTNNFLHYLFSQFNVPPNGVPIA